MTVVGRAAGLMLRSAAELGPPDGWDGDGPQAGEVLHAWRDAAVVRAVEAAWRDGDGDGVLALADGYTSLLLQVPRLDGAGVTLVPAGTGERRRRGAFTTPPALAAVLARHALPDQPGQEETAGSPGAGPARPVRVVDPACGAGALLRAAYARLVERGTAPAAALRSLHGVDDDPAAVAVCRAALAVTASRAGHACRPDDLTGQVVVGDALLGPVPEPGRKGGGARGSIGAGELPLFDLDLNLGSGQDTVRGLVWHEAFGEVLDVPGAPPEPVTGWRGGFDALVANPPWERLKVTGRDWAGAPPARLREARAEAARRLREGSRHPLTGAGELNAYLPFLETCWRLLAPHGRAGIVVPEGVASDRSAARLLAAWLERGALERLHLVAPSKALFDGVSDRIAVAVIALRRGAHAPGAGGPAGRLQDAEVAVGVADPAQVGEGQSWRLDRAMPRLVNPNTGTTPLFRSPRDAAIVTGVHSRAPVLVRRDPDSGAVTDNPWQVRLVTPLHMTRDASWFRTAPGPGLLPLWEAKHAGLLDHRGGRSGHRYWVPESLVRDRYGDLTARGWLAGYRNVTTATSPRTLLPCALPVAGVGNSLPLITAPRLPLLLAALASLPVDYVVRNKHAGANLNFFKLEQAAVPPPDAYDREAAWEPGISIGQWVLRRFAEAVAWDGDLTPLAAELRREGVPEPGGAVDAELRVAALAGLDAVHALLLGLDRDDLAQVLSTFAELRVRDERATGRFATAERVLAAYDSLTTR